MQLSPLLSGGKCGRFNKQAWRKMSWLNRDILSSFNCSPHDFLPPLLSCLYLSCWPLCWFLLLPSILSKISWSCPILKGFRSISNEGSLGFNPRRSRLRQAAVAVGLGETRSCSVQGPLQQVDSSGSKLVWGHRCGHYGTRTRSFRVMQQKLPCHFPIN